MLKVKDIMTTDVLTVGGSASVYEAIRYMREKQVRSLIVERRNERESYGIVTSSDIVFKTIKKRNLRKVKIREIMTSPIIYTTQHTSIRKAAQLMADLKVTHLPVLNKKKELVGIISNIDILYNL